MAGIERKKVEKLELNWPGKHNLIRPERRVLLETSNYHSRFNYPTRQRSAFDNLLIKGDNLLALLALMDKFESSIRCVFIDPPYNTGSAFDHYDDGIEHSIWLSMMELRIGALHRLLADDGSMWITIDDNEAHYLKVVCDEIFGRKNFVSNVVWQKKYTVANDTKWLSESHDHILVYAKNKDLWRPNRLHRTSQMDSRYRNPDGHPKGPWKATPLHAKSGSAKNKAFSYTFRNGLVWRPPPGTYPRYSEDTLARFDEGDEIWFGADGNAAPSRKTFLSELTADGPPASTVWLHSEVGNNHQAREETKYFNASDPFATPKPERLLERIIHLASRPNDIVLDSFAGSGTTGAVAHKMGRRWIMVEMGDHSETHIIPRLKKVIDGEDPGGVTEAVDWKGGGGFRFYRLAPSLLEKDKYGNWVIAKDYNAAMLAEAMCKHMGFTYAPSQNPDEYWMHGASTETDFIFVTTASMTQAALAKLSEEVGPDRTLLICCKAFRGDTDKFDNLTVVKIPQAILSKCEWGRDDYSLNVANLPMADDEPPAEARPKRNGRKSRQADDAPSLFDDAKAEK